MGFFLFPLEIPTAITIVIQPISMPEDEGDGIHCAIAEQGEMTSQNNHLVMGCS
jgi:hypothetical protein